MCTNNAIELFTRETQARILADPRHEIRYHRSGTWELVWMEGPEAFAADIDVDGEHVEALGRPLFAIAILRWALPGHDYIERPEILTSREARIVAGDRDEMRARRDVLADTYQSGAGAGELDWPEYVIVPLAVAEKMHRRKTTQRDWEYFRSEEIA